MSRPVEHAEQRVTKNLRLSPDLDRRLKAVAAEREIAVNVLIVAAITQYLDRLPSVEESLRVHPQPTPRQVQAHVAAVQRRVE